MSKNFFPVFLGIFVFSVLTIPTNNVYSVELCPTIFTSTPITTATEGIEYQYQATATAPGGEPVSFILNVFEPPPSGLNLDPSTGLITWIPDNTQGGTHTVVIQAKTQSDVDNNCILAYQEFEISVNIVNNIPPSFNSNLGDATIKEDSQFSRIYTASDPNNHPIVFSVTSPSGASIFSIDSNQAELTWFPTNAHVGQNTLTVKVTDENGGSATQTSIITVNNIPPIILSSPPTNPIPETQRFLYDVNSSDEGQGNTSYSLATSPNGMTIFSDSGLIDWTPTTTQSGTHQVTVLVDDGNGGNDSQTFFITVLDLGSISGKILDVNGNPVGGGSAFFFDSSLLNGKLNIRVGEGGGSASIDMDSGSSIYSSDSANVDSNGMYQANLVGTFYVLFTGSENLAEFYDDVGRIVTDGQTTYLIDFDSLTPVTIQADTVSTADAILASKFGSIKGNVVDFNNHPIIGTSVSFFDADDLNFSEETITASPENGIEFYDDTGSSFRHVSPILTVQTDNLGNYEANLPIGTYNILFFNQEDLFSEFYDSKSLFDPHKGPFTTDLSLWSDEEVNPDSISLAYANLSSKFGTLSGKTHFGTTTVSEIDVLIFDSSQIGSGVTTFSYSNQGGTNLIEIDNGDGTKTSVEPIAVTQSSSNGFYSIQLPVGTYNILFDGGSGPYIPEFYMDLDPVMTTRPNTLNFDYLKPIEIKSNQISKADGNILKIPDYQHMLISFTEPQMSPEEEAQAKSSSIPSPIKFDYGETINFASIFDALRDTYASFQIRITGTTLPLQVFDSCTKGEETLLKGEFSILSCSFTLDLPPGEYIVGAVSYGPVNTNNGFSFIVNDIDSDNDGIFDSIDVDPNDPNNKTFDDGISSGSVISGLDNLIITDVPGPGINIEATGPANVQACGISSISFTAGEVETICGSITINVISGTVDVEYLESDQVVGSASLVTGDNVTFDDDLLILTNQGSNPVTFLVNGQETMVNSGESVPIGPVDTDGDGVPDSLDICPGFDDNLDNDSDTIPDGCDTDDDNDGISDVDEIAYGLNSLVPDVDSDSDGIYDQLDLDVNNHSNEFAKNADTNNGLNILLNRNLVVAVLDLYQSNGMLVSAVEGVFGGSGDLKISLCDGNTIVSIDNFGALFTVECGSTTLGVFGGVVDVLPSGSPYTVSVSEGSEVTFGDGEVTNNSDAPAVISINGEEPIILEPGELILLNQPPTAMSNGPYLSEVREEKLLSSAGSFDPDEGDVLSYSWSTTSNCTFDDYTLANPKTTCPESGIFDLTLEVTDLSGASDSDTTSIVVYDPYGGFVTGGGWIDSPAGAYTADPTLEGKATFGFVSKYKKGAETPTGETEFQFKVADLNFHSDSYDWLVVAGAKAMYKGTGTINGDGNYGFMLSAIDGESNGGGDADKFRIKIWDESETVIYDNQFGAEEDANPMTEIAGGSIVVHTSKDK